MFFHPGNPNLALILGLSLGIGVPTLVVIIVSIYFCQKKLTRRRVEKVFDMPMMRLDTLQNRYWSCFQSDHSVELYVI